MRARVVGQGGEGPVRRVKVLGRSACGKYSYVTKKLAKAIGHPPKPYVPAA